MKLLEKQFVGRGEVKGFLFTQLDKNEHGFIYKVENGGITHYEVFKRKINKRYDCESYPKSTAFGKYAWCIMDYDRALERFNNLHLKHDS